MPYLSGEEGHVISIENNPLAQDDIEGLTASLGEKLNGFTFRPFTTDALSNPAIEAGDVVVLTDRKGNNYKSFISSLSFTFGSFETYRADAETPNKKESTRFSASTKAIQAAKKETEKQISIYDLSVQQMSNLMSNAMGVYQTAKKQDDGSFIYYAHDKPTLAESQMIWQQTRDAFAVSFDGGETWHGMTADGNIVARILTAIGISADWITTGTLRVGGNFNQSGKIELFDISNTLICLIDKDGITVKCKDGRTIKLNADEGFVGFDTDNTKMYWASEDEFHQRKSVVEDEITIAQRLRFIPITTDSSTGVGIVAMV